jgi:hypothetical protein
MKHRWVLSGMMVVLAGGEANPTEMAMASTAPHGMTRSQLSVPTRQRTEILLTCSTGSSPPLSEERSAILCRPCD